MLARMADVLFVHVMRAYIETLGEARMRGRRRPRCLLPPRASSKVATSWVVLPAGRIPGARGAAAFLRAPCHLDTVDDSRDPLEEPPPGSPKPSPAPPCGAGGTP
ncbi:hypothetical protein BE17_48365 [Sorangium cellulosum]|uniref:Uncharacterized protein n=1 Tax=Sorangium cellulosum TaxID=56 RepID=A0A150QX01_SORCE|nr:hypothetical protein BE17_48365 [Sorangium cellulosum]